MKTTATMEGFERTDCILCGPAGHRILFTSGDIRFGLPGEFNVVRCEKCGLIYVNPRPDRRGMAAYYPAHYPPHARGGSYYANPIINGFAGMSLALYNGIFERPLIPFYRLRKGRILDVGCGSGSFLYERKKEGWEVYGVDISSEAVMSARSLGLDVRCGTLEEAGYGPGFFDVVTMNHSLEHLHDPVSALKEVNRLLKPGGMLLIVVPNIDSLDARIFKDKWDGIDVPRHLYHFSRDTLGMALDRSGFDIKKVRYSPTSIIFGNSMNLATGRKYRALLKSPVCYLCLFPLTLLAGLCGRGSIMSAMAVKRG